MAAAQDIACDSFWVNQSQVMEAEVAYQQYISVQQFGAAPAAIGAGVGSSLASEIEKARNQIKQSLNLDKSSGESGAIGASGDVLARIASLEKENKELRQVTSDLQAAVKKLEQKIEALDVGGKSAAPKSEPAVAKPAAKQEDDDDDDIDLFGSDDEEENEALEKLKEERLKQYNEKKAKKTAVIAKSNIVLDVKPWDDETDMKELEKNVRSIEMDGLLWGTSKLVEVGYGIKKLQISCVVEDDKVSTDDLEEKICAFEDFVQSMDIAAFNKI